MGPQIPDCDSETNLAEFWLDKCPEPDTPLLEGSELAAFNRSVTDLCASVVDILTLPESFAAQELKPIIESISHPTPKFRFFADGNRVSEEDIQALKDQLALDDLTDDNPVTYGLVVRRTSLRRFPADTPVFDDDTVQILDRMQESAFFPGQGLAVLHRSADQHWLFVRSYNYCGWVHRRSVAACTRQDIGAYRHPDQALVVTGAKAFTNYNPENPQTSEVQLDMGAHLPEADENTLPPTLHGQHRCASRVALLPTISWKGTLALEPALIALHQDVRRGPLPLTRRNVLTQAFKFLGERYGWGHSGNSRDCTGFVSEIFRSCGAIMPRNSGQQGDAEYGINVRFDKDTSNEEKLAAIRQALPGDLLYLPGHVLILLGEHRGEPYVIHDLSTAFIEHRDGRLSEAQINGVVVTPLLSLHATEEESYLDRLTSIKRIAAP
ncbi:SH3 domain-containing protein [Biformimicrobium ophioploci]|uniref:SH3 domain-containing protein n=1 Tax=Biformimicrobium ophioploci TaxID=3036711 RepID=A0ABQ6LWY7_9GAMM|nr:SH3 domain-containing protein [Microbulbifer sp. NKW57]GMG86542.1 SH3 domain-containing protein [Microbulbifer sp. NKW57]